jgi:Uncharacterized protein conserved in bacteria (DUF2252)
MHDFSNIDVLEIWYARLDHKAVLAMFPEAAQELAAKRIAKATAGSSAELVYPKLVEERGGQPRIRDTPPTIFHPEAALGIGSVGTACAVALMMSIAGRPFFLQVKEANASVLEPYAGKSVYVHHGERVVQGQRLMQPASDLFLGWATGPKGRHFYMRQLRDVKFSALVETFDADSLSSYAKACGWDLARTREGRRSLDDQRLSRLEGSFRHRDGKIRACVCGPGGARPRVTQGRGARRHHRGADGALT